MKESEQKAVPPMNLDDGIKNLLTSSVTRREMEFGRPQPLLGDNSIRTSKYKPWTFFFLNLFEQLLKPANVYFLVCRV